GRNLVKDTLSSFKTHADCLIVSFKAPCVQSKPKCGRRAQFKPKLRSFVLVLVVVLDQWAFSAAKRARLSRNYFVQLVSLIVKHRDARGRRTTTSTRTSPQFRSLG